MKLRLRELRERKKLSQQALADLAGIDLMTVNRLEMGHHTPRIETLEKLARGLGVDMMALFEREAPRKRRRKT